MMVMHLLLRIAAESSNTFVQVVPESTPSGAMHILTSVIDFLLDWRWVLIFAPALIVLHQMYYLLLVRSQQLTSGFIVDEQRIRAKSVELDQANQQMIVTWTNQFSWPSLVRRFAFCAIFVTFACAWAFLGASSANAISRVEATTSVSIVAAQTYATFGAFTFILLLLGRRAVNRDVTPGIVIWCGVSMLVGPLLGNVVARFFLPAKAGENEMAFVSVSFIAGFAPRSILTALGDIAERFLVKNGKTAGVAPRILPLSQIRGITLDVEERLAEEGVYDVTNLAYANVLALMNNTPFKRRQLIAWIDEAMLQIVLPDSWQSLERAGITGAIDLAWCRYGDGEISKLADATNIEADTLQSIAWRLSEDRQVLVIWALYQSDEGGDVDAELERMKRRREENDKNKEQ